MDEAQQSLRQITKGALIVFLGILLSKVFSYVFRLVVARLGTNEYGLISLGLAILSLLSTFSLFGFTSGAIARYVSYFHSLHDHPKLRGTILFSLKLTLFASLFFAVVLFLFADVIPSYFFPHLLPGEKDALSLILVLLALGLPLDALGSLMTEMLRGFQQVTYMVYAKFLSGNLLKVPFALLFVSLGFGVVGATFAYVLGLAVTLAVAFYFLQARTYKVFRARHEASYLNKELLSYSWPLVLSGLLTMVFTLTDTLMLGYFTTASVVGIYNAVMPTANLIFLFQHTLMILFMPILTDFFAKQKRDVFLSVYRSITKWVFMINLTAVALFALFGVQLVRFLFGAPYVEVPFAFMGWEMDGSLVALVLLASGLSLVYTFATTHNVLMIYKFTRLVFLNTFLTALANVVLNYLLIPPFGMVGAALATSISFLIMALTWWLMTLFAVKMNPVQPSFIKVLVVLTLNFFFIRFLVSLITSDPSVILVILFSLLYVLLAFLLLFLTGTFDKDDLMILKTIRTRGLHLLRAT